MRPYYEIDGIERTFRELEDIEEFIQDKYREPDYKNVTIVSHGDEWTITYETAFGEETEHIEAYETETRHFESNFYNCR